MTRDTVFQAVRIANEATAGTDPGSGYFELTALSIEPAPQVDVVTFAPRGNKYDTIAAVGKDWTQANLSGIATYTEIIYPLSSVLDTATLTSGTATAGTSGSFSWNFQPDKDAADVGQTFTVYVGDSGEAEKFTYGQVNDFTINFSRDTVELAGAMVGQLYDVGETLPTASGGSVDLVPVLPTQVDVYMDTTFGGLGGTQLTGLLNGSWGITGRFNPKWTINSSNASWAALTEIKPDATLSLTMEADSTAMAYLTVLRAGDTRYVRIKASGATIATSASYGLTIDTAVKFQNASQLSDQDGVLAVTYDFVWTPDSNWDGPCSVTVVNDISTL